MCLSFSETPGLGVSCCLALGCESSGTYEIRGSGVWVCILAPAEWDLTPGLGQCQHLPFCLLRRRTCGGCPLRESGEGGWSRWRMWATCSLSSLLHSPHICKTTFVLN